MSVKVDKESPRLMMFKTHHDLKKKIYIKGYFRRMGCEDVNTLDCLQCFGGHMLPPSSRHYMKEYCSPSIYRRRNITYEI